MLCKLLLQHPANVQSAISNAKLSLLLEALLLNLFRRDLLKPNEEMHIALEDGIQARLKKASLDRRKGKDALGGEQEATEELEMSSERIRSILSFLK